VAQDDRRRPGPVLAMLEDAESDAVRGDITGLETLPVRE
jgi:hypothetical protein